MLGLGESRFGLDESCIGLRNLRFVLQDLSSGREARGQGAGPFRFGLDDLAGLAHELRFGLGDFPEISDKIPAFELLGHFCR